MTIPCSNDENTTTAHMKWTPQNRITWTLVLHRKIYATIRAKTALDPLMMPQNHLTMTFFVRRHRHLLFLTKTVLTKTILTIMSSMV